MSRSQPEQHHTNPATRWYEWDGENGALRYYDRDSKTNIGVPLPFTFLLLDQLGSVRGWDDASQSGIYSNEVRDTRAEPMVVKSFKGGILAEGIYKDIKATVNAAGGKFTASLYLAAKIDGELRLAALRFKGAGLMGWMEFSKAHRAELYTKAVTVAGYTEGKKGKVVFRTPTFKLVATTPETDFVAKGLDAVLQVYLNHYLKRNTVERVETAHVRDEDLIPPPSDAEAPEAVELTDSDIPF